jgi:hypothetical protein
VTCFAAIAVLNRSAAGDGQPRVPALSLCLDHYESVGGCAVALSGFPGLVGSGSQLDPRLLRNGRAKTEAAGALAARLPRSLTGVGGVDAHAVFRMRRPRAGGAGMRFGETGVGDEHGAIGRGVRRAAGFVGPLAP